MQYFMLFFVLVSSLFPCCIAWGRMRKKFSEYALMLFLGMAVYAACFAYGFVVHLMQIGHTDSLALMQMKTVMAQYGISSEVMTWGLFAVAVIFVGINIAFGFIIKKSRSPIMAGLILVVATLVCLSIIASSCAGLNLAETFFEACCGIMGYFAWMLDLTYKQFCVIGNIYIQATILLVSSLAPLCLCIRTNRKRGQTALCSLNAFIHLAIFVIIAVHYWMPLEKGFDLCYAELNRCAAMWHTTYVTVNLVIFVFLFVADLIFNNALYRMIVNKQRHQ